MAMLTAKKHKAILDHRQSFFKPRETTMNNAQQEKTPSNDYVQMVDLTMHNLARGKAEIVWSLKSVLVLVTTPLQISTKFLLQCFLIT